jgi:eukaryotic-like serine/threonine-protein kinase
MKPLSHQRRIQDICDKPGPPVGGSWNRDGVIIFGSLSTGLWQVPAAGGTPVPLTVLDASRHEREHELPSFLPDGRRFYLRVSADARASGVYAGSLDDPPGRQSGKRILATNFGAYYVPSSDGGAGRLLFLRDGTLMAQAFDPAKLELAGNPSPVAERVGSVFQTGYFSASPHILVTRTATTLRGYQMIWVDSQGKVIEKIGEPESIGSLRLSPDGARVAYHKDTPNLTDRDLWLLDLARGASTRFTFGQ